MTDINWNYPTPRRGGLGLIDRFIGPGATSLELLLQTAIPLVAIITTLAYAALSSAPWNTLQYIVAAVLAFDIAGGVVTNATSSAKRWYHREGQGKRAHLIFVFVHLTHLSLVSWVFLEWNVIWTVINGLYLLVSAVLIIWVPRYVQRPVAYSAFAGSLLLAEYALEAPIGLEWFLPLFYLKLLVSHLPIESPYRPSDEAASPETASQHD